MSAAARRGGGAGFLGVSAALHLLALVAALWWAGRVPVSPPVEVPVALVWDAAREGAGAGREGGIPEAPPAPPTQPEPPPVAAPAAEPSPPPAPPAPDAAQRPTPPPPAADPFSLPLPPPPAPPVPQERRQAAPQPAPQAAPPAVWRPPARPDAAPGAGGALALGAVVPARPAVGAANPAPEYPTASRIRGEEGQVRLLVQVDAAGRVVDLSVLGSSGHEALDREAERTVRLWRFEPAIQGGSPVFSTLTVAITFRLEGTRRW